MVLVKKYGLDAAARSRRAFPRKHHAKARKLAYLDKVLSKSGDAGAT